MGGVVRVHHVTGVGGNARRACDPSARGSIVETVAGGNSHEDVLEQRASRTGGRRRANLFVIERREHGDVLARFCLLHGDECRVRAGEVVETRRGEEFALDADDFRLLGVEGVKVVADYVLLVNAGDLGDVTHERRLRIEAEDRLQVGLLGELEAVVGTPIEVDRELRNAADRAGLHEVQRSVASDDAARDAEVAIEPRVEQRTAVDLDADLLPAGISEDAGLHLERGRVVVRTDDPGARVSFERLRADPSDDGALADDESFAVDAVPILTLVALLETGCTETFGDGGCCVIRRGRCDDEVGEIFDVVLHGCNPSRAARCPAP